MNMVEQTRFLVTFAKMNLEKDRREGDWMNLREDLLDFLSATDSFVIFDPRHDAEAEHYPKQKIIALQKEVKGLLPLSRQDWDLAIAPMVENLKIGNLTYEGFKVGGLLGRGSFRDMFLQNTINLLHDPSVTSKVAACPSCSAIFVRVRRQKYCSGPCVDKANKTAWLKTLKGKRYLRKLKGARKSKKNKGGKNERKV